MPSDALKLSQLEDHLRTSSFLGSMVKKVWRYDDRTVVVSFDIAGRAASIDLKLGDDVVTGSVLGRDAGLKRHLRNSLVGKAELIVDSTERHLIGSWRVAERREVLQAVIRWVHWLTNQPRRAPTELNNRLRLPQDHVGVFWWDNRSNFGDAVGPWLVERITGKSPVNSRRVKHEGPTMLAVGSIVGHLDRDHAALWGTGLMGPLSEDRLKRLRGYGDVKVHAVRGRLTAQELRSSLGWEVPDVYGDPALLLPRFYSPRRSEASAGSVAVVPHYAHTKHFPSSGPDGVHMVDVAQGLERVVDEIASADSVISTSLHGIIIAQAYGVPWVWLRVDDHQLGGDRFKFNDFFSTLSTDRPARHDVTKGQVKDLDFVSMAREATLPELSISLDDLLAAFPLAEGGAVPRPWQPPRVNVRAVELKNRVTSMSNVQRLKKVAVRYRNRVRSGPQQTSAPVAVPAAADTAGVEKALKAILKELQTQRRTLETIRIAATAEVVGSVQSFVRDRQLDMLETLEMLAASDKSFARFGDGEFRLLVRPEFNLRFQENSPALRDALGQVLSSQDESLLVGFPQLYRDAHWSGIWAELWSDLQPYLAGGQQYGNSHVTRPVAFTSLGDRGVALWRQVWDGRRVGIVTGAGSRFDLVPELFDNVASTTTFYSTATNGFEDLDRVRAEVLASDVDLVLVALGPAGTVLAAQLAEAGRRSLDIGHLSDSYANIFNGAPRPESKPVQRS